MKRFIFIGLSIMALGSIYLIVKRSVPCEEVMQTQHITIDSTTIAGPVVLIFDKTSRKYFWLKSYTSFNAGDFDTLQGKVVQIHYMKVLAGPFENRIFKIKIDSVIVFDQIADDNQHHPTY